MHCAYRRPCSTKARLGVAVGAADLATDATPLWSLDFVQPDAPSISSRQAAARGSSRSWPRPPTGSAHHCPAAADPHPQPATVATNRIDTRVRRRVSPRAGTLADVAWLSGKPPDGEERRVRRKAARLIACLALVAVVATAIVIFTARDDEAPVSHLGTQKAV